MSNKKIKLNNNQQTFLSYILRVGLESIVDTQYVLSLSRQYEGESEGEMIKHGKYWIAPLPDQEEWISQVLNNGYYTDANRSHLNAMAMYYNRYISKK